jgi:hypothetical protein
MATDPNRTPPVMTSVMVVKVSREIGMAVDKGCLCLLTFQRFMKARSFQSSSGVQHDLSCLLYRLHAMWSQWPIPRALNQGRTPTTQDMIVPLSH